MADIERVKSAGINTIKGWGSCKVLDRTELTDRL